MEAVCWCAAQALSHYGRHIGLSRKHSDAHFTVFIHRAEEGAADIRARQLFKKKNKLRNINVTYQVLCG